MVILLLRQKSNNRYAEVMELADVSDSKSDVLRDVWVQVPPSAPLISKRLSVFGKPARLVSFV